VRLEGVTPDVVVVDDGSTDGSMEPFRTMPVHILSMPKNGGIGAAMQATFRYALKERYDIIVIMAGNNKDEPLEIPLLLAPILNENYDLVQGSRFLPGGGYGNMPFYRILATKLHPLLFTVTLRKRITESSNGFRAFRLTLLQDPRIKWQQDWLSKYDLEIYLLYKVIALGYRHAEVPVTKIYPPKALGYTKMAPITGWWSMLRPIVYLTLGLKE
jgi:dolichol-phosphate mannosyltransferase